MSEALVIPAAYKTKKSYVDGTIEVKVLVEPEHERTLIDLCNAPGAPLAIARLTEQAARDDLRGRMRSDAPSTYGEAARQLHAAGFFRAEQVWRAVGSDEMLQAWVREQPCKACKAPPPSEPAHVRSVAAGAGMARKPDYCVIPLCHRCHAIQHQRGICAVTPGETDIRTSRDTLNKWRMETVEAWARDCLKETLGYDSWREVPPERLWTWAERRDLVALLPEVYREAARG